MLTSYGLLTGPEYSLLMPLACSCSTMYQMPALTTIGPAAEQRGIRIRQGQQVLQVLVGTCLVCI
jgi:hypothetical protein